MNNLDREIANTQRNITYAYVALIATVLVAFLFMPKPIDEATKTLLSIILTALIALAQQQSSFWFARQRVAGVPDPATTTSTTTTTTTPTPTNPPTPPPTVHTVTTVEPSTGEHLGPTSTP